MSQWRRLYGLMILGVVVAAGPAELAQGQATTGIIRGTVTDPQGNPLADATVVLRETRTNFERQITTTTAGVFIVPLLPLGFYDATVRAAGFQEARQTGIQLRVGETVDLRIVLGQAVALEAIEIVATVPAVDPTRSEASTRLPEAAVRGLPNNGRDFLNLTLLTPNVNIVQGPDGDELSIAGQRGIHNNISVDGADFNNPFFGEQRGGQRPPFTFNLDAVDEIVVVSNGANAEFGRSSGGFVNVITKSGTNEFHGSAHYFGKYDPLSAQASHESLTREPDFQQHQFGFTLGGPIVRDKAFFFAALDIQDFEDTKQKEPNRIFDPSLAAWIDTAFGGVLGDDDGPITRTDNARALLAKFDFRLGARHNASLKYNYTWSQQLNGTFDVDVWTRSANALEKDFSHAVNGSLSSIVSSRVTNEFRFQVSREDRPRPYLGPTFPGIAPPPGVVTVTGDRPFPDTGIGSGVTDPTRDGFRLGMPFFIPVEYYDSRIQILDNVSIAAGDHLIKLGAEWNRVESVQTFIGFANGRFIFSSVDGFLGYVANGSNYRECVDGSMATTVTNAICPEMDGNTMTVPTAVGPVLLYLQQAGVPPFTVEEAGTQDIPQHEIAVFVQDSWKPHPNLTLNYGIRWEASLQPDVLTPPEEVFFAPFIGQTVNTFAGPQRFPSDGTIPDDLNNWQPRFGFAWDAQGNAKTVIRGSVGWYFARIPGLNLASTRSTNGSRGQTLAAGLVVPGGLAPGRLPAYDSLLVPPSGGAIFPDVFVFDENFENPRTISASFGIEQDLGNNLSGSINYTHASTDNLTRFINRNDFVLGFPWGTGLPGLPGNTNGIFTLTTIESSAKSRYNGVTFGLQYKNPFDPDRLRFQINYTLSYDKSDDDNERDPFTFRYARADNLAPEYNWSDRDQRHRLNAWLLATLPADIIVNNRVSAYSARPISEVCGAGNVGTGQRSATPAQRICPDGSILKRNTLRRDDELFSWDIRLSKLFRSGAYGSFEVIFEIFNVTNTDNFRDPSQLGLLFNFDGTIRSGLGEPRQAQVGFRYLF